MIHLSILSDFCTWWPFWWIVPFLLGCAFGYLSLGKYKSRLKKLESEVRDERASVYKYEKLYQKCQKEATLKDNKIENDAKTVADLEKRLSSAKKDILLLKSLPQKEPVLPPKADNSIADVSKPPSQNSKEEGVTANKEDKQSRITDSLKSSNLQIIQGIGPKIETLLFENGIKNWKDLSSKSFGELRAMLDNYGTRYSIVDPSDWSKQASLAHKSQWNALIKLQNEIGNSSKLQRVLVRLGLA